MGRYLRLFIAIFAFGWASAASAAVELSFHSFNGSVVFGRYPHAFVVMEGTLDSTGARVSENYGFSAKSATPAVLRGPVEHVVMTEKPKWIGRTNRHFTVSLSDAEYRKVKAMVEKWRNAPGKYYDLETRNCIHFVGEIGRLVGLRIEYPDNMLRRPKKWLNHITTLNPQLGARQID
ncbi:MAG: hypothetical protein ACR2FJ_05100 [Qipengyuania sp.]